MKFTYFLSWALTRAVATTYFRCRVYHAERVPERGSVILAANHASFLDPPLVGSGLSRELHYLARDTLFRHPVARWVLESVNSVPVDREGGGAAGLRAIFTRLQRGGGIILFPEGTRTSDGALRRARAGIGLVVIKSDCPVIPVRLFGTYEAFGRHMRFPRPHPVVIKYGEPLEVGERRVEARSCSKERLKAIYQEVADELMRAIGALRPCRDVARFP